MPKSINIGFYSLIPQSQIPKSRQVPSCQRPPNSNSLHLPSSCLFPLLFSSHSSFPGAWASLIPEWSSVTWCTYSPTHHILSRTHMNLHDMLQNRNLRDLSWDRDDQSTRLKGHTQEGPRIVFNSCSNATPHSHTRYPSPMRWLLCTRFLVKSLPYIGLIQFLVCYLVLEATQNWRGNAGGSIKQTHQANISNILVFSVQRGRKIVLNE